MLLLLSLLLLFFVVVFYLYEAFFHERLLHPCIIDMENYLLEYKVFPGERYWTSSFNSITTGFFFRQQKGNEIYLSCCRCFGRTLATLTGHIFSLKTTISALFYFTLFKMVTME